MDFVLYGATNALLGGKSSAETDFVSTEKTVGSRIGIQAADPVKHLPKDSAYSVSHRSLSERICSGLPAFMVRIFISLAYAFNFCSDYLGDKQLTLSHIDDLPESLDCNYLGYSFELNTKELKKNFRKIGTKIRRDLGEDQSGRTVRAPLESVRACFQAYLAKTFNKKNYWNIEGAQGANYVSVFREMIFLEMKRWNPSVSQAVLFHAANQFCREFCDLFAEEMLSVPRRTVPTIQVSGSTMPQLYELNIPSSSKALKRNKPCIKDENITVVAPQRSYYQAVDMSFIDEELNQVVSDYGLERERLPCVKQCMTAIQDGEKKGCEKWHLTINGRTYPVYHISHGVVRRDGRKATLIFYKEGERPRLLALAEHITNTQYEVLQAVNGVDIPRKVELKLPCIISVNENYKLAGDDETSSSGYSSDSSDSSAS